MDTKKIEHSEQFIRQRKFMTVLPLLVLPFVIFFYIALGGGRGSVSANATRQQSGFNTVLPDAHFKKGKEKDKLGIYEEANKDSVKLHEQIKNDPYYGLQPHAQDTIKNGVGQLQYILQHNAAKFDQQNYSKLLTSTATLSADSNELRVIKKLEQLKKALNKKSPDNDLISKRAGINDAKNSPNPDGGKCWIK
jgi:hypothetical protein